MYNKSIFSNICILLYLYLSYFICSLLYIYLPIANLLNRIVIKYRLSNEEICLYDSDGNVNPVSHLIICLRSYETIEEGHLCIPVESSINKEVYAFKNSWLKIVRTILGSCLRILPSMLLTMIIFGLSILIIFLFVRLILKWVLYSKRRLQKAWSHLPYDIIKTDSAHTANVICLRLLYYINILVIPLFPLLLISLLLVEFFTLPCMVTSNSLNPDPLLKTFTLINVAIISPKTMCHRRFSLRVVLFCLFVVSLAFMLLKLVSDLWSRRKDIRRVGRFIMKIDAVNEILNANYGLILKWFFGGSFFISLYYYIIGIFVVSVG